MAALTVKDLLEAKSYCNFAAEHDRVQEERTAACQESGSDVTSGSLPERRHVVEIDQAELGKFWQGACRDGARRLG